MDSSFSTLYWLCFKQIDGSFLDGLLAYLEQFKKINSHFAEFEQAKEINSDFADFGWMAASRMTASWMTASRMTASDLQPLQNSLRRNWILRQPLLFT